MVFRKISVDTKIMAVSRVLRGDRVTAIAREMRLDRNSLALWVWRAVETMRAELGGKKAVRMKRAAARAGLTGREKDRAASRKRGKVEIYEAV